MENYLITSNTLALMAIDNNKTLVIEKHKKLIINGLPTTIISFSCIKYGSSLKGRIEASSFLLGKKYKCPILISESNNIIFFPTSSYKDDLCNWINYKAILRCIYSHKKTIIYLKNNQKLNIKNSYQSICNQITKSTLLESFFYDKKT